MLSPSQKISTYATRAAFIRANYSLTHEDGLWIARHSWGGCYSDPRRSEVVRKAWADWGHFNFGDEAEVFAEIFPRRFMHEASVEVAQ